MNSSKTCLRLEKDNLKEWNPAQEHCRLDGGHLLYLDSDQEFFDLQDFVRNVRGDAN